MNFPIDILLTYGWCRSSYTALRSLMDCGLQISVADVHKVGMCQWSRYKSSLGQYTSPLTKPERFVTDIVRLLDDTGAHFLLPGHDETEVLARYRDRLPKEVILPVADYETIHFANDKACTRRLAASLGLPVPRTIDYSTPSDLTKQLIGFDLPLVVKLRRGNSAKGVFYPQNSQEAVKLVSELIESYKLSPERYPLVQERVSGDGWGVSCLYWQGQRLASFTHKRLREKTATGGTSTLRQAVRNPELESIAHTLLDAMHWHGLAMVEFKWDELRQQGWFIEINPRLWGSIHLAVSSGVDFPALLYIAAVEGPAAALSRVQPQKEGIIARWYLGDAIAALGAMKRGQFASGLRMLLPGGADTLDDWRRDDPGAFLGEAAYYLSNFLKYRSLNPVQEGMLG